MQIKLQAKPENHNSIEDDEMGAQQIACGQVACVFKQADEQQNLSKKDDSLLTEIVTLIAIIMVVAIYISLVMLYGY